MGYANLKQLNFFKVISGCKTKKERKRNYFTQKQPNVKRNTSKKKHQPERNKFFISTKT